MLPDSRRWRLISQSHHKRNGDIEAGKVLCIKNSYSLANPLTTYRHGFVGHYLRACSQAILLIRVYRYTEVGCIDEI